MNYRQVIILTIENDLDAQQFTAKFGELTKNKNIHVGFFKTNFLYFFYLGSKERKT